MTINKKNRQSVMPPDSGIYEAVFFCVDYNLEAFQIDREI